MSCWTELKSVAHLPVSTKSCPRRHKTALHPERAVGTRLLCLRVTELFFFTLACSMLEAREMKGENGSSALMVRLWAFLFQFSCHATDTFSSSFYIFCCLQLSFFYCLFVPVFLSSPSRRHCYHLCGGQQQLQHGYKGRQQHQQATGSPGSLSQYLEQQVRQKNEWSVQSDSSLSSVTHAKPWGPSVWYVFLPLLHLHHPVADKSLVCATANTLNTVKILKC